MNPRHMPLAMAFTLALQGCLFGCPPPSFETDVIEFTEDGLRELLAVVGHGEDVADADADPVESVPGELYEGAIVLEDIDCFALCNERGDVGIGLDCTLEVSESEESDYTLTCEGENICVGGRTHETITTEERGAGPDPIAAWLAQTAHDEAASIHAFVTLAEELAQHGAPVELRTRVLQAAKDEVRHTKAIASLARQRGGVIPRVQTRPAHKRSLEALATENAVEACVHETWAALQAWHQAAHAVDPEIRATMRQIAIDETGHAELGRDLHRWFTTQLDDAAVARVEAAKQAAIANLANALGAMKGPGATALGLPSASETEALIANMRSTVWA